MENIKKKTNGLTWKYKRLRAMGLQEIFHRGMRWLATEVEKNRTNFGWAPKPRYQIRPRQSLFPNLSGWKTAWSEYFTLDRENLDDLLGGRVIFFGHPPLEVGMPVNWRREPLSGIISPLSYGKKLNYRNAFLVGDAKVLWELGRHQHLVPLAVAYALTGDKRYRDCVINQIEGWIADNPYGIGIHWCSSLELALRLITWAVVHSLLVLRDGGNGLFDAVSDDITLGHSIYQQAFFIASFLSRYSSANNHLIGELTGLWITCQVFNLGPQGEHWSELTVRELEREALLQVYADGVAKEQAFYYHLEVLDYLLFVWLVGIRCNNGLPNVQLFSE
jgi:hypothetical protein